jgi:hypothetical protein
VGALRQVRARNLICTLLGLALIGAAGGSYFSHRSRESAALREQKTREVRDLEDRFQAEFRRLQSTLRDRPQARPTEVFLSETTSISHLKRYVLEESGQILAHANSSEVGTRLDALATRMRASGTYGRIEGKSWEGYPSTIRFERIAAWSAYYVLERAHIPLRSDLGLSPFRAVLMAFGMILGIGFLAGGLRAPREADETTEEPPVVAASNPPTQPQVRPPAPSGTPVVTRPAVFGPPKFVPTPARSAPLTGSEIERFVSGRRERAENQVVDRALREKSALVSFDREARSLRGDRGAFEAKLVESVSRATNSPALFFRYDPNQGIASLAAEAGHSGARGFLAAGTAGLSFSIGSALVAEIHEREKKGDKKGLWDHAPLSRLLLSRFGVSHFEAWPMVRARPWKDGPGSLVGVLVVVQSGIDRRVHRDFLGTFVDRASRHYDA